MEGYVGLDVSKEETSFCVVDGSGRMLAQGRALSDSGSLFETLKRHALCPERIVLETGTLSNWLARGLSGYGLPVEVIDARQAHAVLKLQHNKTDANDAVLLAEMARTGFCRPVAMSAEEAQKQRILIKARRHLVRQRVSTLNAVRGFLASLGIRFAKGSGQLVRRVRAALEAAPDMRAAIEPLLAIAEALEGEVRRLDAEIETRAIGPYLGLTSRRSQSGEMDYSGRISKFGDSLLRSLLCEAANVLLNVVRKAHPLKDWARRIRRRHQPQEGLRGAGPQACRDHASHAGQQRSIPLAGKGRLRNSVNKRTVPRHAETTSPAGTVAKAIPRGWLLGRFMTRHCV